MKYFIFMSCFMLLIVETGWTARAKLKANTKDPYLSALVIDAESGKILFDDSADTIAYPASVLKLMDLLIVLDQVEQGNLGLEDMVQVTDEAAKMGGSQVYLDPKEQFSVEDLLYALMVQSANDAAVALATHVAGSKAAFISLMNKKARELGMKNTHFYSVHGLPPSQGQKVDQTTARDLAILARELAKKPEVFKYTNTRVREFRGGAFIMRTHNHLLKTVEGCDGFKTGYFQVAGFSIVATAKRDGVRIIAVVLGSKDRKVRDARTSALLEKGFTIMSSSQSVAQTSPAVEGISQVITEENKAESLPEPLPETTAVVLPEKKAATSQPAGGGWKMYFSGLATGLLLSGLIAIYLSRKRSRKTLGNFRNR